jgi:hypothetical protein
MRPLGPMGLYMPCYAGTSTRVVVVAAAAAVVGVITVVVLVVVEGTGGEGREWYS